MELNGVAASAIHQVHGVFPEQYHEYMHKRSLPSTAPFNSPAHRGPSLSYAGEPPSADAFIDAVLFCPEQFLRTEETRCQLRDVQIILERFAPSTEFRFNANDLDSDDEEEMRYVQANSRKNSFSTRWRHCFSKGDEEEDGQYRQGNLTNKMTRDDRMVVTRSQSMRYRDQRRPSFKMENMDEAKTSKGQTNELSPVRAGAFYWKQSGRTMGSNSTEFRRRTTSVPIRRGDRRSQSMRVPSSRTVTRLGGQDKGHHLGLQETEVDDFERMRTFSIDPSKACIINRGDSFRRRNSTAFGLQPKQRCGNSAEAINGFTSGQDAAINDIYTTSAQSRQNLSHHTPPVVNLETYVTPPESISPSIDHPLITDDEIKTYHIAVVGMDGVGKTSLINQFMTSEYCNPFLQSDGGKSLPLDNTITVQLDGEESRLTFHEVDISKDEILRSLEAHGYLVVYSIDDAVSFRNAKKFMRDLRVKEQTALKPAILVSNKIDLERKRHVTTDDGRSVARDFNCKFAEITVGLGHHIDELLVGILTQVKLHEQELLLEAAMGDGDQENRDYSTVSKLSITSLCSRPSELNVSSLRRSPTLQPLHSRAASIKRQKRGSQVTKETLENDTVSPPTSCSNLTAVGQRFVQKVFGRRRSARSLEDLLSFP